jgi:hypothetical protein
VNESLIIFEDCLSADENIFDLNKKTEAPRYCLKREQQQLTKFLNHTMSTNNQQTRECNILIKIALVCTQVKDSVQCLSSIISPPTNGSKKMTKVDIVQKTEEWILQSVEKIIAVTEDFRRDEMLQRPKPFQQGGVATLFPRANHSSSVLVQVILWSRLSDSCHQTITKGLHDAGKGRCVVLKQKSNRVSKSMMWVWLQTCAWAIKGSAHQLCKRALENKKEYGVNWSWFKDLVSDAILLEICFANSTTYRSTIFFTWIGTNAQPLEGFASRREHSKPLAVEATAVPSKPLAHSMPLAATRNFLIHLMKRPNLAFVEGPKETIEAGFFFPKSSHLSSDILTFMLNNEQVRNHLKSKYLRVTMTKSNPSLARGGQLVRGNSVDKIRRQLVRVRTVLKQIKISDPLIVIERESGKIVNNLSVSLRNDMGKFASSKVAVVSSCVSTLLGIKSHTLSMGENVLLHLFSDALKECNAAAAKGVDGNILEILLPHLSTTLFSDIDFITGVGSQHYALATHNDIFWKVHFPDEYEKLVRREKIVGGKKKRKKEEGEVPSASNKLSGNKLKVGTETDKTKCAKENGTICMKTGTAQNKRGSRNKKRKKEEGEVPSASNKLSGNKLKVGTETDTTKCAKETGTTCTKTTREQKKPKKAALQSNQKKEKVCNNQGNPKKEKVCNNQKKGKVCNENNVSAEEKMNKKEGEETSVSKQPTASEDKAGQGDMTGIKKK